MVINREDPRVCHPWLGCQLDYGLASLASTAEEYCHVLMTVGRTRRILRATLDSRVLKGLGLNQLK